jgi:hypothetical protein
VKDKLRHLLDLFEALSIFVATLMLSELTNDSKAWEQEFAPKVMMSKKAPFVYQIALEWLSSIKAAIMLVFFIYDISYF